MHLSKAFTVQPTVPRGSALSHINVRSMWNKIPLFQHYICVENIDLCTVTKTWLKCDDDIIMRSIPSENLDIIFYMRHNGTAGAGIALSFKSTMNIVKTSNHTFNTMDCSNFHISFNMVKLNLCNIWETE